MNKECFKTFIDSAKTVNKDYEIILVESNKASNYNYEVPNLKIIVIEEVFNFHKFLNVGISHSKGEYYILSNNDVIFDKNWLVELFKVASTNRTLKSFSPYDAKSNKLPNEVVLNNDYVCGYQIQKHITGWCIVMHNSVIKKIKKLDERFNFYYADFDYAMQLIKYNINHALVTKAKVLHLEGRANNQGQLLELEKLPKRTPKYIIKENWVWVLNDDKMIDAVIKYHDKWGSRRALKIKLSIINLLKKIGLGFFSKFILCHKN
ncbi:glycosyltransferase [Sabulilitoribacter arenilitoris]|uniref:Glycosyltransferase n=1 Tax=Wocania arenilitoris TaxID=2044858 RepID=A0AAE3ENY9_9FLAO|nr:glycosyltransferase [Wocania arenilitoris]MCF7568955.1 glycosyltransferase [Wocania arenilitoris]